MFKIQVDRAHNVLRLRRKGNQVYVRGETLSMLPCPSGPGGGFPTHQRPQGHQSYLQEHLPVPSLHKSGGCSRHSRALTGTHGHQEVTQSP